MDSDIRKHLADASKKLGTPTTTPRLQHSKPKNKRPYLFVVSAVALLGIFIGLFFAVLKNPATEGITSSKIVPEYISQSVAFPVYYPDQKKLPEGYVLDKSSFSAANQTVVYAVTYDGDKKIAFTVQRKPSETDLNTFYANQIPLRNEIPTPVGTAAVGVLHNQTFSSLPTNEEAWLLITAPNGIDHGQLKKVLEAIRKN